MAHIFVDSKNNFGLFFFMSLSGRINYSLLNLTRFEFLRVATNSIKNENPTVSFFLAGHKSLQKNKFSHLDLGSMESKNSKFRCAVPGAKNWPL